MTAAVFLSYVFYCRLADEGSCKNSPEKLCVVWTMREYMWFTEYLNLLHFKLTHRRGFPLSLLQLILSQLKMNLMHNMHVISSLVQVKLFLTLCKALIDHSYCCNCRTFECSTPFLVFLLVWFYCFSLFAKTFMHD